MPDAAKLDVVITTSADTSGVVATSEALQNLEASASKTANTISAALAKQELAEKSLTDEQRLARQEAAQASIFYAVGTEKAANSSKNAASAGLALSDSLRQVAKSGAGANQVLEGFAQGGIGGAAQAASGFKNISAGLSTAFVGLAAGVAAFGGGLLLALKSVEKEQMLKFARDIKTANESIARQTALLEANQRAAEASLKAQLDEVEKLTRSWTELDTAVDNAHKRFASVDAAKQGTDDAKAKLQEQQALAAASTPEERATISRRFAGVQTDLKNQRAAQAINQEEAFAKDTVRNSGVVITDSESAITVAKNKVGEKQGKADAALANISNFELGSPAQTDAILQAKAANADLKTEEGNFKKVLASMTAAIDAANAKITAATTTLEIVPEKRKALQATTAADATQRANEARDRVAQARKPLEELAARRKDDQAKLTGLEDKKTKENQLGGSKETVAAIEESTAQLAKDDAAIAAAEKAYAAAQKESAALQLKQNSEQQAATAAAAVKQLEADEKKHTEVINYLRTLQQQQERQAAEIANLKRTVKPS